MTAHGECKRKIDDDEEDESTPPPPDGGWGWMVVFGSFMIHIITDGVTYSFGVFYDEFLTYFNEGKGATSWILSILVGVTLCSGPISSSFVNRWGCMAVTIAGAILASICMVLSVFAQSVTMLYFTIGIGTGFGFGLIYLPAIVSVTMYFEKKRSLATGIAVCGSGFGTFIFAPIITSLLAEYGWRGAMLIVGGIVLECILFGALFRPLEYGNDKKKDVDEIILKQTDGVLAFQVPNGNGIPDVTQLTDDDQQQIHRPRSMSHIASSRAVKFEHNNGNVLVDKIKNNNEVSRLAISQPMLITSTHSEGRFYGSHRGPLYKRDVFYQGSLMNIPAYRSRSDLKHGETTDLMERRHSTYSYKRRMHHEDDEEEEATICGLVPCSKETKDTLREMLDFSLFKDVIFIIFTLSNFLTSIGFNVPYVFIIPRAKTLGMSSEEAGVLISVIGIANTVGRIILGYLSDKPWINRLLVYNLCLTTCGIATILSAFCLDFYTLAIYSAVFGFTIGAYVGLTSVILVDLLGLDKLTNAFGLLLLFQGVASLVGPPIAGQLYDVLESYDPAFYVAGASIGVSGLMLFAIKPIQNWETSKKLKIRNNSADI